MAARAARAEGDPRAEGLTRRSSSLASVAGRANSGALFSSDLSPQNFNWRDIAYLLCSLKELVYRFLQ